MLGNEIYNCRLKMRVYQAKKILEIRKVLTKIETTPIKHPQFMIDLN